MNKQEILKKAQEENKGKDMADFQAQEKGAWVAYFVGVIGIVLVSFITDLVTNYFNYGPIFVIFLMAFTAFVVKFITLRKRHELMVAIWYGISAAIFLTLWILQLCKVI